MRTKDAIPSCKIYACSMEEWLPNLSISAPTSTGRFGPLMCWKTSRRRSSLFIARTSKAGADCIETASYQVSRSGYSEFGFAREQADAALLRSVALARAAASEFPERHILVAASLGPFGAVSTMVRSTTATTPLPSANLSIFIASELRFLHRQV